MSDPWSDLEKAADWLLSIERDAAVDVVHLNHLVHGDLPWRAPVLSVGHSCVLSWWAATQPSDRVLPAEWNLYRRRVAESLQAADCVVAPTETLLSQLASYYGPFRRSLSIANARNRRHFRAGCKEKLVFSAGRLWDPAKNLQALAAVAPKLSSPVVVAGEARSPHANDAPAHLPNTQMLGSLPEPELADWYSRAAIYALPARYEPFGLTALEAALSGCALVLGDIPSLREVWGPSARYVAPDDQEHLRDTLQEMLANEGLRGRFAARSMAQARHYTPARQMHKYLALYRMLAGSRMLRQYGG
jgi:glycogen synthase